MKSLRSVNLNLLPILREILRKGGVTRAAESLGMSQPAVSDALAQLRRNFDDELLVLDGRNYVPTALARRLGQQLELALTAIEDITLRDTFDPASATGTIKIASTDYAVLTWGAVLAAHVAKLAPNVSLDFEEVSIDIHEKVMAGIVDFGIIRSGAPNIVKDSFQTDDLFEDNLVCLVPAHSSIGDIITHKELEQKSHVIYSPSGLIHQNFIKGVLENEAITVHTRISVQGFSLLPHLVATTETVALTLRGLNDILPAHPGVRVVELPFQSPKVNVIAISRRDADRDPLLEWLREQFPIMSLQH